MVVILYNILWYTSFHTGACFVEWLRSMISDHKFNNSNVGSRPQHPSQVLRLSYTYSRAWVYHTPTQGLGFIIHLLKDLGLSYTYSRTWVYHTPTQGLGFIIHLLKVLGLSNNFVLYVRDFLPNKVWSHDIADKIYWNKMKKNNSTDRTSLNSIETSKKEAQ